MTGEPTPVQAQTDSRNDPNLELSGTASHLRSRSLPWGTHGPIPSYSTLSPSPPGLAKFKHLPSSTVSGTGSPHLHYERMPKSLETKETAFSSSPSHPTRTETIGDGLETYALQYLRHNPWDILAKKEPYTWF